MKFKYVDDAVKHEYKVVYLDKFDNKVTTYVTAYSEKQAQFYVLKHSPNCVRVLQIIDIGELPNSNGKQLMMDLGDLK